MKSLLNSLLLVVVFATAAVSNGQVSLFYYSTSPQSVVAPGKAVLIQEPQVVGWGYDESPTTFFSFGTGWTDPVSGNGVHVTFMIPFSGSSGTITNQTFSFTGQDVSTRFTLAPSMILFGITTDPQSGKQATWSIPEFISATFTVHELTVENYSLVSAATTFALVEGPTLDGLVKDYGVMLYNSNYVVTDFPTASAIPEPSTYAAIAGALVLGVALYRRKHRKQC